MIPALAFWGEVQITIYPDTAKEKRRESGCRACPALALDGSPDIDMEYSKMINIANGESGVV